MRFNTLGTCVLTSRQSAASRARAGRTHRREQVRLERLHVAEEVQRVAGVVTDASSAGKIRPSRVISRRHAEKVRRLRTR